MRSYIAILHKDENSDHGVSFPDFRGCVTAGSTIDEAKDMAHEALQFHIDEMKKDGDSIPEPSSLESVMRDKNNSEGVALVVNVIVGKLEKTRVNVSFDKTLLKEMDERTRHIDKDRSRYLSDLVRNDLHV